MNKKDQYLQKREFRELIDSKCLSGTKQGNSKCWKGVSYDHYRVMSDIVWKLVNEYGMRVFTEVIFKTGGRADIFAYNGSLSVIIEVLHSESEKKYEKKKSYYPKGIPLMMVKTKDFDLKNFKI